MRDNDGEPASPAIQPATLTGMKEPVSAGHSPRTRPADPAAWHDATLLLAALDEIEVRRAALEWLVDSNLLCRCLV
jgi:hypothetical protein